MQRTRGIGSVRLFRGQASFEGCYPLFLLVVLLLLVQVLCYMPREHHADGEQVHPGRVQLVEPVVQPVAHVRCLEDPLQEVSGQA